MREICTSGSTRGQWVAFTVTHCSTLLLFGAQRLNRIY